MHRIVMYGRSMLRRSSGGGFLYPGAYQGSVVRAGARVCPRVCPVRRLSDAVGFADDDGHDHVFPGNYKNIEREEYHDLLRKIKRYDDLYYSDDPHPEVSDEQYDNLVTLVEKIEQLRPEWVASDSPTQTPGYARPSKNFEQVVHSRPMLSLAKTYTMKELEAFVTRAGGEVESSFCAELKMDGVALRLVYRNGRLARAVTRGDGNVGDDVTRNAAFIGGVPQEIPPGLGDIEVTGEVCILTKDFEDARGINGSLSNVRNAAAGGLKLLDGDAVQSRKLSFIAYELASAGAKNPPDFPPTQSECLEKLNDMGFTVSSVWRVCTSAKEILDFASEMYHKRVDLPLEVDGIVVKVNNFEGRQAMGATRRSPRGAVAHKFSGLQAQTKILDVTYQVSRNGALTPVAQLVPVGIGGVTISRATLHNFGFLEELGIRQNDTVVVERGGDVIPKIVNVDESERPDAQEAFAPIGECPACGETVFREDRILRCRNVECRGQILEKLIFFASKAGMQVDHLGEKTVQALYELGKLKRLPDFFRLTQSDLMELVATREKKADRILSSIWTAARERTLAQVIHAIGIPGCGDHCAELLVSKGKTLDGVLALTEEDLMSLSGIGSKGARSLFEHLQDPKVVANLKDLRELGVSSLLSDGQTGTITDENAEESDLEEGATGSETARQAVLGKAFVFTGTLDELPRDDAAGLVTRLGGLVRRAVSRNVDYVVAGKNSGKKKTEAEKLGVPVIDQHTFMEMVGLARNTPEGI